jgi:DNA-binding CsgD family transcriptional regulator
MSPPLPLVVVPEAPPCSDEEVARLLDRLVVSVGCRWVTLDLELDGSGRCFRYSRGEVSDSERDRVEISAVGVFAAQLWSEPQACSALEELAPLVRTALEQLLALRTLRQQVSMMRRALDSTRRAVLLFDRDGNIVYANPSGDELLSRQTESGLRVRLGKGPSEPLFTALCRRVEGHDPSCARSADRLMLEDGSQLMCEVLSLELSASETSHTKMLVIETVQPPRRDELLERVGSLYRLTDREHQVLALLCRGLSTTDVAADLGISPHTVRDHVKRLYRKTGTRSRAELLRLVERAGAGERGAYTEYTWRREQHE